MKDRDVIEQIQQGNDRVLSELYQHFTSVRKYVLSNSGMIEDAEDVFAEAMVIFYERVRQGKYEYTGEGKIGGFLYSTSKNLWLKRLSRAKPQPVMTTSESYSIGDDPLEELTRGVDQIIRDIGEPCGSILVFFYFEKLDMLTIAQKLGYKNKEVAKVKKRQCIKAIENSLPASTQNLLKEHLYELDQRRPGSH